MTEWAEALNNGLPGAFASGFGVYNQTPHDVTLGYLEMRLREFQELDMGWFLTEFSGPFGVLDSDRADVVYEKYQGHQLDRELLEVLQRY
jgi:endoglucanase